MRFGGWFRGNFSEVGRIGVNVPESPDPHDWKSSQIGVQQPKFSGWTSVSVRFISEEYFLMTHK